MKLVISILKELIIGLKILIASVLVGAGLIIGVKLALSFCGA